MSDKDEAKVYIVVSVPMEYLADFITSWDEYRERLIEHGGIDSAYIEAPESASRRIELR